MLVAAIKSVGLPKPFGIEENISNESRLFPPAQYFCQYFFSIKK